MDKNKDGVVTIDEFIESCQKVSNESKNYPFGFPNSYTEYRQPAIMY